MKCDILPKDKEPYVLAKWTVEERDSAGPIGCEEANDANVDAQEAPREDRVRNDSSVS